jgi:hypothetical protein
VPGLFGAFVFPPHVTQVVRRVVREAPGAPFRYGESPFGHKIVVRCTQQQRGGDGTVLCFMKISLVYLRMPRGGHPEDDYMSLPVL